MPSAAESAENRSQEDRISGVSERLARVERQLTATPSPDRVQKAEQKARDARKKAEKALKEERDLHSRVVMESTPVMACDDCGREVAHPELRPPECPECGASFRWDVAAQNAEERAHEQEQRAEEGTKEKGGKAPEKVKAATTE